MSPDASCPCVLIPGEINLDLILHGFDRFPALGQEVLVNECLMTLGSASAIAAVGLSRLGVHVRFVGRIGAADWGNRCLDAMQAAGVATTFVLSTTEVKTGVTVSISAAADRALVTFPGTIGELTIDDIPAEAWEGVGHLHVSSFYLQRSLRPAIPQLFQHARDREVTVSLDPGGDPEARWEEGVRDAIGLADLFLPNEVELEGIGRQPDPAQSLATLQRYGATVVAKLGARGCLTVASGKTEVVSSPRVTVVDTTGAGDSFNAGFLAAWLRRAPLIDCMRDGVYCGALATRGLGGTTTQPDGRELATFRSGQSKPLL